MVSGAFFDSTLKLLGTTRKFARVFVPNVQGPNEVNVRNIGGALVISN